MRTHPPIDGNGRRPFPSIHRRFLGVPAGPPSREVLGPGGPGVRAGRSGRRGLRRRDRGPANRPGRRRPVRDAVVLWCWPAGPDGHSGPAGPPFARRGPFSGVLWAGDSRNSPPRPSTPSTGLSEAVLGGGLRQGSGRSGRRGPGGREASAGGSMGRRTGRAGDGMPPLAGGPAGPDGHRKQLDGKPDRPILVKSGELTMMRGNRICFRTYPRAAPDGL
jgi:hypothetical protein